MQPSTQTNTLRSIFLFIVVGAMLLAVVIFGVRWAKGRSDHYAQASNKTSEVAQQPQPSQPKPAEESQPGSTNQNSPQQTQPDSSPQPAPSTPKVTTPPQTSPTATVVPQHVPETGVGDLATPMIGFSSLAVAGAYYVQSRRKLWRLN